MQSFLKTAALISCLSRTALAATCDSCAYPTGGTTDDPDILTGYLIMEGTQIAEEECFTATGDYDLGIRNIGRITDAINAGNCVRGDIADRLTAAVQYFALASQKLDCRCSPGRGFNERMVQNMASFSSALSKVFASSAEPEGCYTCDQIRRINQHLVDIQQPVNSIVAHHPYLVPTVVSTIHVDACSDSPAPTTISLSLCFTASSTPIVTSSFVSSASQQPTDPATSSNASTSSIGASQIEDSSIPGSSVAVQTSDVKASSVVEISSALGFSSSENSKSLTSSGSVIPVSTAEISAASGASSASSLRTSNPENTAQSASQKLSLSLGSAISSPTTAGSTLSPTPTSIDQPSATESRQIGSTSGYSSLRFDTGTNTIATTVVMSNAASSKLNTTATTVVASNFASSKPSATTTTVIVSNIASSKVNSPGGSGHDESRPSTGEPDSQDHASSSTLAVPLGSVTSKSTLNSEESIINGPMCTNSIGAITQENHDDGDTAATASYSEKFNPGTETQLPRPRPSAVTSGLANGLKDTETPESQKTLTPTTNASMPSSNRHSGEGADEQSGPIPPALSSGPYESNAVEPSNAVVPSNGASSSLARASAAILALLSTLLM